MSEKTCLCPFGSNPNGCTGNCNAVRAICQSIHQSAVLQFDYDGAVRRVEPHYYGVTSRSNQALRAYQTNWGGTTPQPGWHMFLVGKMRNIVAPGERFTGVRSGYNPSDSAMNGYFARL